MKKKNSRWARFIGSLPVQVLIYTLMLLAIFLFFTGNGEFIYEGF